MKREKPDNLPMNSTETKAPPTASLCCSESVRLRWHCGYYVGAAKWQNSEDYEPDDCDTDFETEDHDRETWEEKSCSATCPTCGAELTQKFDAPELLPNIADQRRSPE